MRIAAVVLGVLLTAAAVEAGTCPDLTKFSDACSKTDSKKKFAWPITLYAETTTCENDKAKSVTVTLPPGVTAEQAIDDAYAALGGCYNNGGNVNRARLLCCNNNTTQITFTTAGFGTVTINAMIN